jgi:20S proteasome subunit alpha 7
VGPLLINRMTAIGAGYDLSVSTFSPEGRIFQVEYACKAVENSGTSLGLVTPQGVLLAIEKPLHSKLLKRNNLNRRIETVDLHAGLVCAGFAPDALHLANRAREDASNHRETFQDDIKLRVLAERLSLYIHAYTMYASVRPFGVSTLLAGVDETGPKLYLIEPDGSHFVRIYFFIFMIFRDTRLLLLEKGSSGPVPNWKSWI